MMDRPIRSRSTVDRGAVVDRGWAGSRRLDLLLHRLGWSVQAPAWRAAERDEEQIAAWREKS